MWKKVKLLKMNNFTFFHNVFYAICIFKSFNSHISVVVCRFFIFATASKLCIREWVKLPFTKARHVSIHHPTCPRKYQVCCTNVAMSTTVYLRYDAWYPGCVSSKVLKQHIYNTVSTKCPHDKPIYDTVNT